MWRLGAFVPQDVGLLGVGVSNAAAIALLVGCVQVAACPSKLRYMRNGAVGLAVAALVPFVGAVVVLNRQLLETLMEYGWDPRFTQPLIRHVVCCFVIMALGAFAAASPALAVALSAARLRWAKEPRNVDLAPLQKWAAFGGVPLGLILLWTTWGVGDSNVGRTFATLWTRSYTVPLIEVLVACLILLALPAAAVTAFVVPLLAATRNPQPDPARAPWSADPSRFIAYPAAPPRPNPPVNLQA